MALKFDEFDSVTLAEWMEKITKDLKGKDPSEFDYHLGSGIQGSPFTHRENRKNKAILRCSRGRELERRQDFSFDVSTNKHILEALNNGVTSIGLSGVYSMDEVRKSLEGVLLEHITIHAPQGISWSEWTALLEEKAEHPEGLKGTYSYRGLADALYSGHPFTKDQLVDQLSSFDSAPDGIAVLQVDITEMEEWGVDAYEQVSMALIMGHEYLVTLIEGGVDSLQAAKRIHFKVGIGNNFFAEIAKLRSLRILWKALLNAYRVDNHATYILAESCLWNKSSLDSSNNLLRLSTEGLAGMIGEASAIQLNPYDAVYAQQNETSLRYARNIQNILIEEAHANRVVDAAKGSYLIDQLTEQFADAAWNDFQDKETSGGFFALNVEACLEKWKACFERRKEAYKNGERTLIGVNKYVNQNDDVKSALNSDHRRLAKMWEEER